MQFPTIPMNRDLRNALLGFGLTLGGAAVAWSSGLADRALGFVSGNVEFEVILLFVPLAALVFAIVLEVTGAVIRGKIPRAALRPARAPRHWGIAAGR